MSTIAPRRWVNDEAAAAAVDVTRFHDASIAAVSDSGK